MKITSDLCVCTASARRAELPKTDKTTQFAGANFAGGAAVGYSDF